MNPIRPKSTTRELGKPVDWDEAKNGKCDTLPIEDLTIDTLLFMRSLWKPSADELATLNAGGCVELYIQGSVHPVVAMSVSQPEI
jgi:hypothetical protein